METVRTKFKVVEIKMHDGSGGQRVVLTPSVNNSVETKSLWNSHPSGSIELYISNPDAYFDLGEYFIDFTKIKK